MTWWRPYTPVYRTALLDRTWPEYGPYPGPPHPNPLTPRPTLLLPLNGSLAGDTPGAPVTATGYGPVRWVDALEPSREIITTEQFVDEFDRADTSPGTLGNGWAMTGDGYLTGHVSGNKYVGQENIYAYRDVGFTPTYLRLDVSWVAGGPASVTLVSSPNDQLLDDMVHFRVGDVGWNFQVREESGAFVDLAGGSHTVERDGRVYTVWMLVEGTTATIHLPSGATQEITDARIPALMGPWCTWQIIGDDDPPAELPVRIHRAEAAIATFDEDVIDTGRQAALLEGTATNVLKNPAAAVNDTVDFAESNVSIARTTDLAFNGPASFRVTKTASGTSNVSIYFGNAGFESGTTYTFTAWLRSDPANPTNVPTPRLGMAFEGPYSSYLTLSDEFEPYSLTFTSTGGGGPVVVVDVGDSGDSFIIGHIQAVAWPVATSPVPAINADGSLPTGYSWAGTAHNSASTRAHSSITVPLAEEPVQVMARYTEDGETWVTAYQEPGVLGTYSGITWGDETLTIQGFRSLRVRDVLAFDRELTSTERQRIEARMVAGTLDWESFG